MLEELDRPIKRTTLAQDVRVVMRVLEMVVAYTEGGTSLEVKVRKLRTKLAKAEKECGDKKTA